MISNNLWTASQTAGHKTRDDTCRKRLKESLKYTKKSPVTCMVTGVPGNSEQVVCGHIVPQCTKQCKLQFVGMNRNDVNNVKNLVFWSIAIEQAYEHLELSFIQVDPLRAELCVKIWNDDVRQRQIFPNSPHLVGEFEGKPLELGSHEIFTRGLSYQAYQAYISNSTVDSLLGTQCLYGSPGTYSFQLGRNAMKMKFQHDLNAASSISGGSSAAYDDKSDDAASTSASGCDTATAAVLDASVAYDDEFIEKKSEKKKKHRKKQIKGILCRRQRL
jgi:hypothetical protein